MSLKFQAAPKDELVWHGLDSMTLLFHRPSGITHMLAEPAPAILEVMDNDWLTAAAIAQRLSRQFEIEPGANAENVVSARLNELFDLGLVARVSH
ncbi:HPr-rel-A system PqqD family peptide chaperone [Parasphingorhabdus sp.]|uniref:HPr-rel-A system PqqD family peptide chaperone n=1 Tax=Parasphingorhabdus sp. TaxID=2709688 RepID=UPI003A92F552